MEFKKKVSVGLTNATMNAIICRYFVQFKWLEKNIHEWLSNWNCLKGGLLLKTVRNSIKIILEAFEELEL